MAFPTDIEIAQAAHMLPITEIAVRAGLDADDLIPYGKYKAKISEQAVQQKTEKTGKLVLVTAINPTPAGEGKTTTTCLLYTSFGSAVF